MGTTAIQRLRLASMGPRLLSRGVCEHLHRSAAQIHRFNGAAASQPRSHAGRRQSSAVPLGFNGAAASQPRSPDWTRAKPWPSCPLQWGRGFSAAESSTCPHTTHFLGRASMGPRLLSRGVRSELLGRSLHVRRFNGAAASQPRSQRQGHSREHPVAKLQWGRGFSAAESAVAAVVASERALASMGPRLLSRGVSGRLFACVASIPGFNGAAASQPRSLREADLDAEDRKASMGPRLLSRGVARAGLDPAQAGQLQWGRGFSAAESRSPRVFPCLAASLLQWGRGFSAAESPSSQLPMVPPFRGGNASGHFQET